MNKEMLILDRPPRIQPELPFDQIEIPQPPDKDQSGIERLIQVALPLMTIIGYVLIASLGGRGRSPWLMIPMALSVVASTAFAIYSHRKEKQRQAEIERAYSERLVELNRDMHEFHEQQRRFYFYKYPGRKKLFSIVEDAKRDLKQKQRKLRSEARIYERRVEDADFGAFRLGIGTLPSTVLYTLSDAGNFEDKQVREALKLQEDSRFVSNIPVILNLRAPVGEELPSGEDSENQENVNTPFSHAVGIAGEASANYEYIRFLLAQYSVFHAPMDAKLYVLANQRHEWRWLKDLPHSQADEHFQPLCFANDYKDQKRVNTFDSDLAGGVEIFLEQLRSTLAQRKIRLQDQEQNEGSSDPRQPFLLVVIDLLDSVYDTHSPLSSLESDAAISILLEEGAKLGAAIVFLVPERSKVPSGCRSVIEIERTTPATNSRSQKYQRLHFRYAEIGVNSYRYVGRADRIQDVPSISALATELSLVDVKQGYGANLASSLSFLDLMGVSSLTDLLEKSEQQWRETIQPERADWLRVKFARMSGNKDRTLVFSAKSDGVHGMIAGSTGSGKSELLISMIAGMAVRYNPDMLNFVLVDYKGGGAFKGIEDLPHVVDLITNLEGNGVTRMFTAIQAELERRQRLLTDADEKNIVDYYKNGRHLVEPLPFLFIIIDEFAEMIADRSEYKGQLETITRVGRSLGVSLVLAAQNPAGVTDQMRSNIKFRICLRVETPAQSRELLRRTDAAFLPSTPGRGYLQVGNDEIELIQVAYTGDKYTEQDEESVAKAVLWPDRHTTQDEGEEAQELYRVIVRRLNQQAASLGIRKQRAPWPEFLPDRLALNEPLAHQRESAASTTRTITSKVYLQGIEHIILGTNPGELLTLNPFFTNWTNEPESSGWRADLNWQMHSMRPVVGLVDDPINARQLPLVANLHQGHTVLYGAPGWGKSVFVRTLALSLAATHSPNHLHMYMLDLGGRTLSALEGLPHVGSVISPDEEGYEERVAQLIRVLEEAVYDRKELLSSTSAANIYEYNTLYPERVQPAILVAIDNFFEFRETFGGDVDDETTVLSRFIVLARQARPYGIHFVITATQPSVLSYQLATLFTEKMTLKLSDPGEYRGIVGDINGDIKEIPGRGYAQIDRVPMAFQIALPFDLSQSSEESRSESDRLDQFITNMADFVAEHNLVETREERRFHLPQPVRALPQSKLFRHMLASQYGLDNETLLSALDGLVEQEWATSRQAEEADWLAVALGVISGDRARTLHFEAKRDGVHGLIAGGTGSGKSELLMTLIVGLALRYDPAILNFVLVDYKGGGAFKPFEDLPHCVDIITNLNKSAVVRMFTSVRAEMHRRQKLNADTETKDIVEYRRKGLHKEQPYPHLFIIIDEYAEMIEDVPEFRDELESITRVGRSLGVNLLLASQRPVGVTDQMRANIKYRICLRVEQIDTSREMLRRPDAAFLPSGMPGRGYLQVGNEHIELIQIAWTGDEVRQAADEDGKPLQFFDFAVKLADRVLHKQNSARPGAPWPPMLAPLLTFSDQLPNVYLPEEADQRIVYKQANGDYALNPYVAAWTNRQPPTAQSGPINWPMLDWKERAMKAVVGVIDDPYNSRLRPLMVDLKQGHGVIFGGSGWGKTTFLRSLVLSLVATHSPKDLNVHVLDMGGRNLEGIRGLPHVGTLILPDERGYEERIQQLLRELHATVDERRRKFSDAGVTSLYEYNQRGEADQEPAILFLLDNFFEFVETFGNKADQDDREEVFGSFVALARQGKAFGVHLFISASEIRSIPSKLYSLFTERFTLRLANTGDYSAIVGGRIDDIDAISGRGFCRVGRRPLEFQVAVHPGVISSVGESQTREYVGGERALIQLMAEQMKQAIKTFALSYTPPLQIDALPPSKLYRAMLADKHSLHQAGDAFLEQLKERTRQVWERNRTAEAADWLQAPIGVISGNRERVIKFEANVDGVHGMIAGGTGSGKSELLMTLIVGLALNYPPDILNFILVDYKGGGAFKPFEKLPHCVDIVTNLNESAVERMFTAINAEMKRRQALNQETSTKDIIDYRRKGFHLSHKPYPHLFVIIDEYAEMIDKNPDYRTELESITRVGRAQGVNLLLASQKPKGVTDQMRANIKLRICLRVEEQETSREMLRRPDAALLPNGIAGRGYIQVGNENVELIQVAWTGDSLPRSVARLVTWSDRPTPNSEDGEAEKIPFFTHAVNLAEELWRTRFVPKPWPGFLPQLLSLESQIEDAQTGETSHLNNKISDWLNGEVTAALWPGCNWDTETFNPVIGLVDNPVQAKQERLAVDLKSGHLVILGDSGYGKTSLMRTLLTDLATTHSPAELHAYILDLGGRNYGSLVDLPHVGAVIYADEPSFDERLNRFLNHLDRIRRERQQLLGAEDAPSIYEYNRMHPQKALPAILVMIDNFAELQEGYDQLIESKLMPLVRSSLNVGIAFVVTANVPNNLSSKLYSLFGYRITFQQTNRDRYMEIVGRGASDLSNLPGRGYVRLDGLPFQFQSALPLGIFNGGEPETSSVILDESKELRRLCGVMQSAVSQAHITESQLPESIEILDTFVSLEQLLNGLQSTANGNRIQAAIGIGDDLSAALIDLARVGHFAILGLPLSGRTTTLYSWLLSLAYCYTPDQVAFVLVDIQRKLSEYGGNRNLQQLPHVLRYVTDSDEIPALLQDLAREASTRELQHSKRHTFVVIDNYDDFADDLKRLRNADSEFAVLARRYGQEGMHFIAAGTMKSINVADLWRQIRLSNHGIVLRNSELLSTLNAAAPRSLQGKELHDGRAFLVRSAQAGLIQIASPYPPAEPTESLEQFEEKKRNALDQWIERICGRHAAWTAASDGTSDQDKEAQSNAKHAETLEVVSGFMQYELRHLTSSQSENGSSASRLILDQIALTGIHNPLDLKDMQELLRQKLLLLRSDQAGVSTEVFAPTYKEYGLDDILGEAKSILSDEQNGNNPTNE